MLELPNPRRSVTERVRTAWQKITDLVPHGRDLSTEEWERRHLAILIVSALSIVALVIFGFYRGYSIGHLTIDGTAVAVFTAIAAQPRGGRKLRSSAAAVGLLTAASMSVHLSGGTIEAHFGFFVVIPLLMLYQDWLPFLVAIAYTVGEHGTVGVLLPSAVYNHAAAQRAPWLWALIHGAYVSLASGAMLVHWKLGEIDHQRSQESETSYRRLFADHPQPMWVFDTGTLAFLDVNDAAVHQYGYSAEEFSGMTVRDVLAADDIERFEEHLCGIAPMAQSGPWRLLTKTGRLVLAQISSHKVPFGNADARHVLAEDVTSKETLLEELRHQAFHDALTGLPNRALAVDRLVQMSERASRSGNRVAVIFCDLDRFKPINDSLGHAVGDELLRQTAQRFSETLRASDTLARLGGDEFVALCEVEDEAAAVRVAHRLGASLIQPMELRGHEVRVSASIGVAMAEGDAGAADDLIRNADLAMYRAKNQKRGEVEVFAPAMLGRAVRRLSLEQDLRPAMGREEFELYYQPVVSADDGELLGFEALMRWNHPELGMIAPNDFIDIAEDTGFIITMGAWVIGEACEQLAAWNRRSGKRLTMSVNVSAKQLADPGLVDYLGTTIRSTGIEASQLRLEVTESLLMTKFETSMVTIEGIEALGVGVTIDDFGTGYSSLSYLAKMSFDSLKIDRSFVAELEHDERARVLAATVINMAHSLGVPTVGEGVETERQADILRGLGCDMFQGYLFGRPVGLDSADQLVGGHARLSLAG